MGRENGFDCTYEKKKNNKNGFDYVWCIAFDFSS
jgi:hypothetical protein